MNMYTGQPTNARFGGIVLRIYTGINALLLVAVCVGLWVLAARANSHGIPPNTTLGFRSQHTLASLHGWYVAQRVGFHFAAIAATIAAVAALALVIVGYSRRLNPMLILVAPAVGGLAIGVCLIVAGQHADRAAVAVENSAALSSSPATKSRLPRYSAGELCDRRGVHTLSTRPNLGATT
jgi:hypothetical protein